MELECKMDIILEHVVKQIATYKVLIANELHSIKTDIIHHLSEAAAAAAPRPVN